MCQCPEIDTQCAFKNVKMLFRIMSRWEKRRVRAWTCRAQPDRARGLRSSRNKVSRAHPQISSQITFPVTLKSRNRKHRIFMLYEIELGSHSTSWSNSTDRNSRDITIARLNGTRITNITKNFTEEFSISLFLSFSLHAQPRTRRSRLNIITNAKFRRLIHSARRRKVIFWKSSAGEKCWISSSFALSQCSRRRLSCLRILLTENTDETTRSRAIPFLFADRSSSSSPGCSHTSTWPFRPLFSLLLLILLPFIARLGETRKTSTRRQMRLRTTGRTIVDDNKRATRYRTDCSCARGLLLLTLSRARFTEAEKCRSARASALAFFFYTGRTTTTTTSGRAAAAAAVAAATTMTAGDIRERWHTAIKARDDEVKTSRDTKRTVEPWPRTRAIGRIAAITTVDCRRTGEHAAPAGFAVRQLRSSARPIGILRGKNRDRRRET